MKNINIHKPLAFLAIIAFAILSTLTFAANSQAAAMPDYERLQALNVNLTGPSGVALDAYENIYVADSKANRLVIYNSDGTFADMISGLDVPISVAVGNGRIYVGNSGNGDVSVYDLNHNYIMSISGVSKPTSLAVDSAGRIYVVDSDAD
jgi:DNA-binding beta-propeller fold protein YncE